MNDQGLSYWFRQSAPYIHAFRKKTFVVHLQGELFNSPLIKPLIQDLALLNSLRIQVVLVFGARSQIEQQLSAHGLESQFVDGLRVTQSAHMTAIDAAVGQVRSQVESVLSMGLVNTPMHGAEIQLVSGNYVVGRPVGVHKGVDFGHTGKVRAVAVDAINAQLGQGNLVVIPPTGYSPSGERFNLGSLNVATAVAEALKADKLVLFSEAALEGLPRELSPANVTSALRGLTGDDSNAQAEVATLLTSAAKVTHQDGVARSHIVDANRDGALLDELFTRDGIGVLVTNEAYDEIRPATPDDLAGIMELIQPLQDQGALVDREPEQVERFLGDYHVVSRDGTIVACMALHPYGDRAEIACAAVHPEYRRAKLADKLLSALSQLAKSQGIRKLFALSTQTAHWFIERGFNEQSLDQLPPIRKEQLNTDRGSKLLMKDL